MRGGGLPASLAWRAGVALVALGVALLLAAAAQFLQAEALYVESVPVEGWASASYKVPVQAGSYRLPVEKQLEGSAVVESSGGVLRAALPGVDVPEECSVEFTRLDLSASLEGDAASAEARVLAGGLQLASARVEAGGVEPLMGELVKGHVGLEPGWLKLEVYAWGDASLDLLVEASVAGASVGEAHAYYMVALECRDTVVYEEPVIEEWGLKAELSGLWRPVAARYEAPARGLALAAAGLASGLAGVALVCASRRGPS